MPYEATFEQHVRNVNLELCRIQRHFTPDETCVCDSCVAVRQYLGTLRVEYPEVADAVRHSRTK